MKKLITFDMDGTIYLGNKLIDGAKETFEYLKSNNIKYVFLTNNSSHNLEEYLEKMLSLGIDCTIDNFYSSIEVTINELRKRNLKDIFVLGNKCLKDKLKKYFNLVYKYEKGLKVDAVVSGFYSELIYEDLKSAALFLETTECEYYATNGDFRCPVEDGLYIPDCGGMSEWLYLTTGRRPVVLGKPNPQIIYDVMNKYNLKREDIMNVGDRLYTDIKVGINAGVDTVCVLSGESSKEDIIKSEDKPTFIIDSIKDLPSLLN